MKDLLTSIVSDAELHAKWLNSLSMMENCGARKISAGEHSQNVDIIVLKHAAEEARHAYYLKSQIRKVDYDGCKTYGAHELLAPIQSAQYLHRLDTSISRYLKEHCNYNGHELRYASYLLVTYAIELRADELYPVYEEVLKENESPISVRMIVAEEKGHLEEMIEQMNTFFGDWKEHGDFVVNLESQLFNEWQSSLHNEVETYSQNLQATAQ